MEGVSGTLIIIWTTGWKHNVRIIIICALMTMRLSNDAGVLKVLMIYLVKTVKTSKTQIKLRTFRLTNYHYFWHISRFCTFFKKIGSIVDENENLNQKWMKTCTF